jgi:GNAT superfamily N-acetyltransferase
LSAFLAHYHIRQATVQDAPELARLRWDFSDQTGQRFEVFAQEFDVFLQHALASSRWTIWVAEAAEKLLANIYIQLVQKVPRPGRPLAYWGYVTNVYVEPFARNHAIGSHLLQTIQQWAQSQHVEFFVVWPAEESVQFYRRNGFVPNEEILECPIEPLGEAVGEKEKLPSSSGT